MKQLLVFGMPFLISLISLGASFLDGKKYMYSPAIKLANQFLWVFWIYISKNWGFMPLAIILIPIYYRNHLLWTRAAKKDQVQLVKPTEQ